MGRQPWKLVDDEGYAAGGGEFLTILANYYNYTTLGGWVLASLELDTRLLLRLSLHRRRVSKVAYPLFLELLRVSKVAYPVFVLRALEPVHPETVKQWTNENVFLN